MDSGSIGPLPPYCSMNRNKGEMKSANTPSMSKPTFMETQFKQIGDEGQPTMFVGSARVCYRKNSTQSFNRPRGARSGRPSSGASGSGEDRRAGAPRGGHRQHHGRREVER